VSFARNIASLPAKILRKFRKFPLHRYSGGYEEYKAIQVKANKRKLHRVWADGNTLESIARHIVERGSVSTGICHGARNGFEVEWLRERLSADVIGTDISDTAEQFDHMKTWDFHDENPEWSGKFDFVYTNSLDQAMDPEKALSSWVKQLSNGGRIYIEHTLGHSAEKAGATDPFGADPKIMPKLLNKWGGDVFEHETTLKPGVKDNNRFEAFVLVVRAK